MTDIIDRETAALEFQKFVDTMDLDLDVDTMDNEDRKDFTKEKDKLIVAIQKGRLTINDRGEPTYTPQRSENKDPITFYEPTGATLMAMDRKKRDADVTKMYAAMADMTKQSVNRFSKMSHKDCMVCQSITTLFLA